MSRDLNKIQLIGRLGTDPEMRYTPSGTAVTEFRLAVNRRRRSGDAPESTETDWFSVICWERLAEIADQYLTKGTRVYVEGRLQIRRYTNRDGQDRTAIEVVANDMIMLSPRGERVEAPREPGAGTPSDSEGFGDDLDEVPF